MNKAELKAKWEKYCDTDKLVDDVMALLTKYHHRNTENGVCTLLDTYFTNKSDLIEMFKASSHYIGDMKIVVDIEMERGIDGYEVREFCRKFIGDVDAKSAIIKYEDEDGKTLNDYLLTGIKSLKASDLIEGDILERLTQHRLNRQKFVITGETTESNSDLSNVSNAVHYFGYNLSSSLKEDTLRYLNDAGIKGTYAAGMKTSRAFNRMCSQYGIHTLPEYNRLFAKYSDMVSGLKRKMKFFISLNPLDYLTMSFGNSWASCHTIDKRNERNMPNDYSGMYCGGTLSYMLDSTSIITYVYNSMPESVEEGKIYRNMFHYKDGTLIQGRIYPQGNDGATDLYKEFRNIVQRELSAMLGLTTDAWTKKSGSCSNNVSTDGVHYADYYHFRACNVSYMKEVENARNNVVPIGHVGICTYCGGSLGTDYSNRLAHSSCG